MMRIEEEGRSGGRSSGSRAMVAVAAARLQLCNTTALVRRCCLVLAKLNVCSAGVWGG
jgi:hypothetical protein